MQSSESEEWKTKAEMACEDIKKLQVIFLTLVLNGYFMLLYTGITIVQHEQNGSPICML